MKEATIPQFWARLSSVSRFTFESDGGPASQTGWDGEAVGAVEVIERDGVIEYCETCRYTPKGGGGMDLKNRYRWTLLPDGVNLAHIRRIEPVDLVTLVPVDGYTLVERTDHLCGDDCYRLRIELKELGFDAIWTINGPRKNERIYYRYR